MINCLKNSRPACQPEGYSALKFNRSHQTNVVASRTKQPPVNIDTALLQADSRGTDELIRPVSYTAGQHKHAGFTKPELIRNYNMSDRDEGTKQSTLGKNVNAGMAYSKHGGDDRVRVSKEMYTDRQTPIAKSGNLLYEKTSARREFQAPRTDTVIPASRMRASTVIDQNGRNQPAPEDDQFRGDYNVTSALTNTYNISREAGKARYFEKDADADKRFDATSGSGSAQPGSAIRDSSSSVVREVLTDNGAVGLEDVDLMRGDAECEAMKRYGGQARRPPPTEQQASQRNMYLDMAMGLEAGHNAYTQRDMGELGDDVRFKKPEYRSGEAGVVEPHVQFPESISSNTSAIRRQQPIQLQYQVPTPLLQGEFARGERVAPMNVGASLKPVYAQEQWSSKTSPYQEPQMSQALDRPLANPMYVSGGSGVASERVLGGSRVEAEVESDHFREPNYGVRNAVSGRSVLNVPTGHGSIDDERRAAVGTEHLRPSAAMEASSGRSGALSVEGSGRRLGRPIITLQPSAHLGATSGHRSQHSDTENSRLSQHVRVAEQPVYRAGVSGHRSWRKDMDNGRAANVRAVEQPVYLPGTSGHRARHMEFEDSRVAPNLRLEETTYVAGASGRATQSTAERGERPVQAMRENDFSAQNAVTGRSTLNTPTAREFDESNRGYVGKEFLTRPTTVEAQSGHHGALSARVGGGSERLGQPILNLTTPVYVAASSGRAEQTHNDDSRHAPATRMHKIADHERISVNTEPLPVAIDLDRYGPQQNKSKRTRPLPVTLCSAEPLFDLTSGANAEKALRGRNPYTTGTGASKSRVVDVGGRNAPPSVYVHNGMDAKRELTLTLPETVYGRTP